MNLEAGIPAWTLRAVILCAVAAITILLTAQGVSPLPAVLVGFLGALAVLAPASPAPAMVIIATAVCTAVVHTNPLDIGVLVLLPLVHLVHSGTAIAAVIPGTARIHLSALRPTAIRFAVVQGIVAVLVAVAAIVPNTVTPTVLEAAALMGVAALAAIALKLILKRPQ